MRDENCYHEFIWEKCPVRLEKVAKMACLVEK